MENESLYNERLSSNKTEALFIALAILFLMFFIWQVNVNGLDTLAIVAIVFFGVFLFYSVNYITLRIQITSQSLKLKFGVFTWTVPLDNIESCRLDELPLFLKYGGAGVHFFVANGRYRASFNFLEHPRIVVAFKNKAGPVRDMSFSTKHPEDILRLAREKMGTTR